MTFYYDRTDRRDSRLGEVRHTVGEMDRFVQSGGAVNFLLEDNKVRFEINVDAAAQARLKISSKLLALARSVIDNRGEGRD